MKNRKFGLSSRVATTFVNGNWDEDGEQILDDAVRHGLRPQHRLLEVGGPGLRVSQYFINHLNVGNYTGWDIGTEVGDLSGIEALAVRRPRLVEGMQFKPTPVEFAVVYHPDDLPLVADIAPLTLYVGT